jgi:predicted ATP-grasp superfamily ATP-dependent carboligase
MEVNPRLWGSLQLAIDAGIDFPALLWRLHRDEPLPPIPPARNSRLRWLLGDIDHLWIALRDAKQRQATGRSAWAVLRDFARSFFDGSRLEVLRWSDPAPFLRELRAWLR